MAIVPMNPVIITHKTFTDDLRKPVFLSTAPCNPKSSCFAGSPIRHTLISFTTLANSLLSCLCLVSKSNTVCKSFFSEPFILPLHFLRCNAECSYYYPKQAGIILHQTSHTQLQSTHSRYDCDYLAQSSG